ncbi:MAG: helix-turn-helix transcriptional regulator [Dehalococcoidales bacterium]|jgi:DNA-binding XRE family transcriptional regulator
MIPVRNKIKEYRKSAGMTQLDLAYKLGFREKTICYWETGRSEPHVEQAVDIARILGVAPEKIFPGMFGSGVDEGWRPVMDKNEGIVNYD